MKQCRTCGTKLPDNVVTCTRCGSNDLVTVGQQNGMRPQGQQMQGQGGMRPQQGMRPQPGQQIQGGMRPQPGQQNGMRPQGQQMNSGMRPQQNQQMQNTGFDNGYGQNQNQMNNGYNLPNGFDINGDAEIDLSKKKKGLFGKGNKNQNNNNSFGTDGVQSTMQTVQSDMSNTMQAGGYPIITVGQWLLIFIQLIIPIWNIIFIVKTLTNKHENPTKQNYLKSYLIMFVISMIFVVIINMFVGSILMSTLS